MWSLPYLYLDVHSYCVLAKLHGFMASQQAWKEAQLEALKDEMQKLYAIRNFFRQAPGFLLDKYSTLDTQSQ